MTLIKLKSEICFNNQEMTIHEIFNIADVQEVEMQILRLFSNVQNKNQERDSIKMAIRELLKVRKRLLDKLFVMDEYYKSMLYTFNEAMIVQLLKMRNRTIAMCEAVVGSDRTQNDIIAIGKCFLGYEYSKIHPIQTIRAKRMWMVLNGTYDSYMPLYDDGVSEYSVRKNESPESANYLLWLDEKEGNCNECLDPVLTADMHLTYAFHNLWSHMDFSIFDLLWVRDFNIEIIVEHDYNTYHSNCEYEDVVL